MLDTVRTLVQSTCCFALLEENQSNDENCQTYSWCYGLSSSWTDVRVEGSSKKMVKINCKHRVAPEGTWVSADGIEISSFYFLCGVKVHESRTWEKRLTWLFILFKYNFIGKTFSGLEVSAGACIRWW